MVFDSIANAHRYYNLLPGIKDVFDYVENHMKNPVENGRYDVSENVYVMVKRYPTEPADKLRYETHKKWVDVQVMINGTEYMGWRSVNPAEWPDPYDPETDASFHPDMTGTDLKVEGGMFVIFFPEDAHKPGYYIHEPEDVEKLVFKVKLP